MSKSQGKNLYDQRVNADVRAHLIVAAGAAFPDAKLRKAEAKALDKVLAAIAALPRAFSKADIATFTKHGMMVTFTSVEPAYSLHGPGEPRTFELPDGTTVTRPNYSQIYKPPALDAVAKLAHNRHGHSSGLFRPDHYPLLAPLDLPIRNKSWNTEKGILTIYERSPSPDRLPILDGDVVCPLSSAFSRKLWDWYGFAEERYQTERKVTEAMRRIIKAARRYQEIVDVWPGAGTTISQMVVAPVPKGKALLVLSDEDRSLVCGWMKDNKQRSAACEATPAVTA